MFDNRVILLLSISYERKATGIEYESKFLTASSQEAVFYFKNMVVNWKFVRMNVKSFVIVRE